jgi:gas vesicle structural protein
VTTEPALTTEQRVTLVELVDRVLDKGVVISGDVTLAVADVDLVYLGLRAVLASVASAERAGLTAPPQPSAEG